jgi:hypothetical protein
VLKVGEDRVLINGSLLELINKDVAYIHLERTQTTFHGLMECGSIHGGTVLELGRGGHKLLEEGTEIWS